MTTTLDLLENTGHLNVGKRRHLLRPDLSNVTVCGRHDFNTIPDRTLARPANPDAPVCGMCSDPGAARERAERAADRPGPATRHPTPARH